MAEQTELWQYIWEVMEDSEFLNELKEKKLKNFSDETFSILSKINKLVIKHWDDKTRFKLKKALPLLNKNFLADAMKVVKESAEKLVDTTNGVTKEKVEETTKDAKEQEAVKEKTWGNIEGELKEIKEFLVAKWIINEEWNIINKQKLFNKFKKLKKNERSKFVIWFIFVLKKLWKPIKFVAKWASILLLVATIWFSAIHWVESIGDSFNAKNKREKWKAQVSLFFNNLKKDYMQSKYDENEEERAELESQIEANNTYILNLKDFLKKEGDNLNKYNEIIKATEEYDKDAEKRRQEEILNNVK